MTLDNKIAIVTGAASGIGLAIAKRYAQAGGRVAIADLKLEAAQAAADGINAEHPGAAMAVEMDVTSEDQVNAGVAKVAQAWGGVDILVSNAGIQIVNPVENFAFADWKKMLAIHLDGAFLTSKAVLPHMYARGAGTILFMGSVHSKEASPLKSAYVTAKHGLEGLSKVVALEGAERGVTSNTICPGYVRTPLVENQLADQAEAHGIDTEQVLDDVLLARTPVKRLVEPDEVARLAVFLCAPGSESVTGSSFMLDGGWTAA